jgi:hypothetical protein
MERDDTLNIAIAEALGWTVWMHEDSHFGPTPYLIDTAATKRQDGPYTLLGGRWEQLRVGGVTRRVFAHLLPAWDRGSAIVWLEDELARRGQQEAFIHALIDVLGCDMQVFASAVEKGSPHTPPMYDMLWQITTATPRQRAEAALRVLSGRTDSV